jgi:TolB-like protein
MSNQYEVRSGTSGRRFRFDDFEVDCDAHRLSRSGTWIRLREQSFQVLTLLIARAGQVVSREELRHGLWADDTFVDFDNGLNVAVGRLREALSDSADHPRYVETLPRLGYRFLGQVIEASPPAAPCAPRPTARLLVLPFVNSSGDASLEYFSDAVTDELTTELSTIAPAEVGVIARTTAMHYKGTSKPIGAIARELTLDWVLEGSVRRTDAHMTLTAQLIRVSDEIHVLARRFEAPCDELFSVERAVARAVGDQIGVRRGRDGSHPGAAPEAAEVRPPTSDLVAYNHYIQGRRDLERVPSPELWKEARLHLEAAIARDPQFALAHDALAEHWFWVGFFALVPPLEALRIGMPHAERAVDIDGSLAEARAMLAQYHKQLNFDWQETARQLALALELSPASPLVRMRYAVTGLMPFGYLDEAVRQLDIALELNPLGVFLRAWLAVLLWLKRDYARAIEESRLLIGIAPDHFISHFVAGVVYSDARIFTDAVAALRKAVALSGGSPFMLGWLGHTLAESGDRAAASEVLLRLESMPPGVFVPPTSVAWIHLGLGEIDRFFERMIQAIDVRDHMITPIRSYPFLDSVRGDERYADLLRRMHLP